MSEKPFALVLMPFAEEFDDIYKLGIREAAIAADVIAERVDEQIYSETMIERIYRQIEAADFIIADMTGMNANVFYEVGFAHAKGKLCTLLTQEASHIPFDLKNHRHLIYGGKIGRLRDMLAPELEWLKGEVATRNKSPFHVELRKLDAILVKTDRFADAELTFKFDLFNRTGQRSAEIETIYLHTGRNWTIRQNGEKCPSSLHGTKVHRHFLKPPITRLSPNSWAPIELQGTKRMWSVYTGQGEAQDTYRIKGYVMLEIVTSAGTFCEKINIDETVDEFPF